MNENENFSKEQQSYLQGLIMGADVARAIRGLPILSNACSSSPAVLERLQIGGSSAAASNHGMLPAGSNPNSLYPPIHLEAQKSWESKGKSLCAEEKAKRDKDWLSVWNEIGVRAQAGEFPKGTDVFLTKFYGMFYVAPAQNSFMCRMRFPGGWIRSDQLNGVARLADEHAGGYVDITTRANLQLREIPVDRPLEVLMGLRDLGIINTGAGADNVRNVTCSTLSGIDPTELIETYSLARELHYHLLHKKELFGLPRKFNIAFEGGGRISSLAETNDVSWQAVQLVDSEGHESSEVGMLLGLGGITGHNQFARSTDVVVKPKQCIPVCEAILRVFIQHGDRTNRKRARLKYLLDEWGFDKFIEHVEKEYGQTLRRLQPNQYIVPDHIDRWAHVDVHPQKQEGFHYLGIICPVGRLTSEQCRFLATIANRYGDGTLRLTVWQNIILPGIRTDDLEVVKGQIESIGLDWRRSSIRAGLVACTGSAGCKFAGADTKADAKRLADYLEARLEIDQPINIHFTGCHHSCAQHAIADIGLIATKVEQGEDMVDGYHILIGGRTGIDPSIGTRLIENVVAEEVPYEVERILELYLDHREQGESFADYAKRADWSLFTLPSLRSTLTEEGL